MKRERAKELLPIIQAYAEGKPFQYKARDTGRWCYWNYSSCSECSFSDDVEYRIPPKAEEPQYRPFKSCKELVYYWERKKVVYSVDHLVMMEIWVKHKVDGRRRMIVGFGENFVEVGVKAKPMTLERLFETYTFLDDEPCGVKDEII